MYKNFKIAVNHNFEIAIGLTMLHITPSIPGFCFMSKVASFLDAISRLFFTYIKCIVFKRENAFIYFLDRMYNII